MRTSEGLDSSYFLAFDHELPVASLALLSRGLSGWWTVAGLGPRGDRL